MFSLKVEKKMKITVCQILDVWRIVRSFHTEILDHFSRLSCHVHSVVVMKDDNSIPKKTGAFLLLASGKIFLAWHTISAVNVSLCSRMSTGKSLDEGRNTMASTLQADSVNFKLLPMVDC